MQEPVVTIGITCFREGTALLACWKSVLHQTDERWCAVLVLDGGGDAETEALFDSLTHPKLRKYKMPANAGPYPTRNQAFVLTTTPYHFYLDGDDQLPPDAVGIALTTFEQHPDAAFVYGDYQCFGDSTDIWRFPTQITPAVLAEAQAVPAGSVYSKSVWEALGGFAVELARGNADYDFIIGAIEAGYHGVHCGAVLCRYRVTKTASVSSSYRTTYHQTHDIIVRRHPQFFADPTVRARFLAVGYQQAALANARAGQWNEAIPLARTAVEYGNTTNRYLGLIARGSKWGFAVAWAGRHWWLTCTKYLSRLKPRRKGPS